VLASDIELYPNPGLIPNFLDMIRTHLEFPQEQNITDNDTHNRKVYPLSIFELKENCSLPINKTQLVKMLKKNDAVPFHKHVSIRQTIYFYYLLYV
jgi:N-acetyllactosaminide beta-1,3-N-acetylglucosaminyltransferase